MPPSAYNESLVMRRRLAWVVIIMFVLGAALFLRLFYLQTFRHDHYLTVAANTHTSKHQIPAARGQIYTRDDDLLVPLALNQTLKQMYADPSLIKNPAEVAQKLASATGGSAADYQKAIERGGRYQVLATKLNEDTGKKIKALNLTGIGLVNHDYRVYPEGSLASQLLGFVNRDGQGQYGIEGFLNDKLNGEPGLLNAKTDTNGIPIATAENTIKPAVDGDSVVLSLDRNIQAQAETFLKKGVEDAKAKSGSILVMDPKTGAVLAMANYPTYNGNEYNKVTDYSVYSNKVVNSQIEPGSGFKAFTMAAGLNTGKIKPDTTFDDTTGKTVVDGITIGNADDHKGGPNTTMTTVLRDSLNTGVIFVLKALGTDPGKVTTASKQVFYDYITRHFGFGVQTGIEQAGEVSGSVPTPNSTNVDYANMVFGQGISVTMMQMVTAVSAIANGGTLYQPYLVAETHPADGGEIKVTQPRAVRKNVISAQAAKDTTAMMQNVVDRGSGYLTRTPGYKIAGKTGTAQIPRKDGKGYEEGKNIGTFVGFAPVEDPKFVMMVEINEPQVSGFAERTTVPVFANVGRWLLRYYGIPPSS